MLSVLKLLHRLHNPDESLGVRARLPASLKDELVPYTRSCITRSSVPRDVLVLAARFSIGVHRYWPPRWAF